MICSVANLNFQKHSLFESPTKVEIATATLSISSLALGILTLTKPPACLSPKQKEIGYSGIGLGVLGMGALIARRLKRQESPTVTGKNVILGGSQSNRLVDLQGFCFLKSNQTSVLSSTDIRSFGIPNVGNSCYINSALQCLFNLKAFREKIFTLIPESPEKAKVTVALKNIFQEMQVGSLQKSSIMAFKKAFGRTEYADFKQQDIMEFYQHLIEHIAEENRQEDVTKLFSATPITIITCLKEHSWMSMSAPMISLSIPLTSEEDGSLRIQELYEKTKQSQSLQGKADCHDCQAQVDADLITSLDPTELPPIFVIQLKRFGRSQGFKVQTPVTLDEELEIEGVLYRLKSVSYHRGETCNSGHYTAEVFRSRGRDHYDDHTCSLQREPNAEKNAYVLFYERI